MGCDRCGFGIGIDLRRVSVGFVISRGSDELEVVELPELPRGETSIAFVSCAPEPEISSKNQVIRTLTIVAVVMMASQWTRF